MCVPDPAAASLAYANSTPLHYLLFIDLQCWGSSPGLMEPLLWFLYFRFLLASEMVSCDVVQASLKTMLGQTEPPKGLGLPASIHLRDQEIKVLYFYLA